MARKGFMNALKQTTQAALLASALYATPQTLYAAPLHRVQEERTSSYKILQLPSPLTQQTPDFYKNHEKEFEFYKRTYISVAKDEIIDSKDVRTLEHVLSATLKEIDSKILNQHDALKDSLPASDEVKRYLEFVNLRRYEHNLLQRHLSNYDGWLKEVEKLRQYLHFGIVFNREELLDGQAKKLTKALENSSVTPWGVYDPKHNTLTYSKVLRPRDELQPQPKMN